MRCLIAWLGLVLLAVSSSHAQGPSESNVKAALIFNFIKFVEWPDERESRSLFQLCLLGNSEPMLAALASLEGKTAQNRELRLRRVSRGSQITNCQVLVLGESEAASAPELLRSLRGQHLLTISDIEGFAEAGGIISLLVVEQKVRFDINTEAARQANLKVSSQLLKLARSVRDKP